MNENPANPNAPAWAWILTNAATIDRVARRFAAGLPFEYEDFRGELIADLAHTFPKYDPARSPSPTNWVWMRARAVRRSMARHDVRNKALRLYAEGEDGGRIETPIPLPTGAFGHAARSEARTEVLILLSGATPPQVQAARAEILGLDRSECERRGWTGRRHGARLRSLALVSEAS